MLMILYSSILSCVGAYPNHRNHLHVSFSSLSVHVIIYTVFRSLLDKTCILLKFDPLRRLVTALYIYSLQCPLRHSFYQQYIKNSDIVKRYNLKMFFCLLFVICILKCNLFSVITCHMILQKC